MKVLFYCFQAGSLPPYFEQFAGKTSSMLELNMNDGIISAEITWERGKYGWQRKI